MKKILFASACALALTTTAAMAQSAGTSTSATVNDDGKTRVNSSQHVTTGSAAAAHNQSLYGGSPDAGGGPRGTAQATNNPNASKEIGGGR